MEDALTIGTHDGNFHCDEALACFMLLQIYPAAQIVRTRDYSILEHCNIVVDVGNIYNHDKKRYDHHQRSFKITMNTLRPEKKWFIQLSSAGLIYYHYGMEILKKILQTENELLLSFVFDEVYKKFIQEIDAIDNGIPATDEEPRYRINSHLSSRVNSLNKPWNVSEQDFNEDEQFKLAMKMVGEEFVISVKRSSTINYPAKKIVTEAIKNRFKIHESGEVIELSQFCPWQDHFYETEIEQGITPAIKYVLFSSNDSYRIRCIPVKADSFICRKFLPESWRGLRDKELSDITGIKDGIFVHHNGFIAGTKTREAALKMVFKTLDY